ncbi:hypothetical protein GGR57DRAFT_304453 [Xylariaceae sp. FL1272]|nr:hypothetical protein GGR57DRAFT_304453 [Xylariaceae sp. FL1272]
MTLYEPEMILEKHASPWIEWIEDQTTWRAAVRKRFLDEEKRQRKNSIHEKKATTTTAETSTPGDVTPEDTAPEESIAEDTVAEDTVPEEELPGPESFEMNDAPESAAEETHEEALPGPNMFEMDSPDASTVEEQMPEEALLDPNTFDLDPPEEPTLEEMSGKATPKDEMMQKEAPASEAADETKCEVQGTSDNGTHIEGQPAENGADCDALAFGVVNYFVSTLLVLVCLLIIILKSISDGDGWDH